MEHTAPRHGVLDSPVSPSMRHDPATGAFGSPEFHEDAERAPGIVVYRVEAPLTYANAGAFWAAATEPVDVADRPAWVLAIDREVMFAIDFTGTEALEGVVGAMRARGGSVQLARVHQPVLEKLRRSGGIAKTLEESVFPRIEDATAARSPIQPAWRRA